MFIESGGPGGAERALLELAKGFVCKGHLVEVATLRPGWLTDQLREHGIKHHLITSNRRFDLSIAAKLASLAREIKADVIHSHLLDSNFYAALAAKLAKTKHVATEHGDVHHTSPKKLIRTKLLFLNLLGSRVTAVSDYTGRALVKLGISPQRLTIIGNPLGACPKLLRSPAEIRIELQIPPKGSAFVWICVANLHPVKDHRTLLKAFAKALSICDRPLFLTIVGDGPERSSLESLAKDLGIEARIRFLGFRKDVHDFLSAADGFVISSRSEALPMSLLEAAQFSLPTAATAVGGLPEVVQDDYSGWLTKPGDIDSIATALVSISKDPQESRRRAENLKRTVLERFSLPHILELFERTYT